MYTLPGCRFDTAKRASGDVKFARISCQTREAQRRDSVLINMFYQRFAALIRPSARTCVFMSRTSSMNDCCSPPLNPSMHRMPSEVIEMFVIVQLCTWSGRPAIITCSIRHFLISISISLQVVERHCLEISSNKTVSSTLLNSLSES